MEKFSRVEVITGISKIMALQSALGKYKISGMTVYQVLGCHLALQFQYSV